MILFAHGARDPQWATPFQRLQEKVAAQQSDSMVTLAYLELMTPTLAEAVSIMMASGTDSIHVVPLFLGPGAHFRQDFSALMEDLHQRYPHVTLTSTPVLGESDTLLSAIAHWISLSLHSAPV
ncbi:MAG: sirohydrochlorin chelatase [Sulfuriferula sp.]